MKQLLNLSKWVRNVEQYQLQPVQPTKGKIPTNVNGTYYRNGIGVVKYQQEVIGNWQLGTGAILKVQFRDGQCFSQIKNILCQAYKSQSIKQKPSKYTISKFINDLKHQPDNSLNPANTSIMLPSTQQYLLAICDGGYPFKILKKNLKQISFDNFSFISKAYSAHPKIDPETGQIYNIGMNFQHNGLQLTKCTNTMKLISDRNVKLRSTSMIHDCCLAGDYFLLIECPLQFSILQLLTNKNTMRAFKYNPALPSIIHIFRKDNFQVVKKIQTQPFMMYHFTNGFSNDKQIVFEYVKYQKENATQLLNFLEQMPKFAINQGTQYYPESVVEQVRINLKNFQISTSKKPFNIEFPVCDDNLVGKQWNDTYAVMKDKKQRFLYNNIIKYNRQKQQLKVRDYGEDAFASQPVLIKSQLKNNKLDYVMSVVCRGQQSFVQILNPETLQLVCEIKLPKFVPPGSHGKWDQQKIY